MDIRSFMGKKKTIKPRRKVLARVPVEAALRPATRAAVNTLVKKAISRETENKMIGWVIENQVFHNAPIGAADCVPIVQQISPGTSAQQRVGDRIKPKRLVVRGTVSFRPDTCNTNQNFYVRLLVLAQKNLKVGSQVAAGGVDTGHLLRPGYVGSDQKPFSGVTLDLDAPINTDLFRVYMDKTIKLTCSLVTGGGTEPMPLYSARFYYRFKQLPASLTYDDGNGNWANNFSPFFALGYAYSDGSTDLPLFTRFVTNTNAFLEYEDA